MVARFSRVNKEISKNQFLSSRDVCCVKGECESANGNDTSLSPKDFCQNARTRCERGLLFSVSGGYRKLRPRRRPACDKKI